MEPNTSIYTVLLGDPRLPDPAKPRGVFTTEDREAVVRLREALAALPGRRFEYVDDHEDLLARLVADPPARVFNLADTGFRNRARQEAHLVAWLEMLDVPVTGAGPDALLLCYDKPAVTALADRLGVPVPRERLIQAGDPLPDLSDSPLPAMVKPATGDGSEGIEPESVVSCVAALTERARGLRRAFPDRDLLVQEFLPGEEYAVGLIGNPGPGFTVLPPLRVDYAALPADLPPILSYGSKTDPESPYWTGLRYEEASPGEDVRAVMVSAARALFARLGCRDYARFDFREDAAGTPRLLEVNPNPAWCWDGKMNLMAGFAGWSYPEFLDAILSAADARFRARSPGVTTGPGG